MNKPIVSVVMSVYNGGQFLEDAINSILNQTFVNFEFIIINDGSTDDSIKTLQLFDDKRIRLLDNQVNKGLIYSLNRGLSEARGKYIVRMDADDISLPRRIEKQVDFMERNPEIGICGSYIEIFGDGIKKRVQKFPSNPKFNEAYLLFSTCLAHPSVIIRKSVIDINHFCYENRFLNAEDYAFWVNAIKFTKISNIKEVLLKYRVLFSSITRQADMDINLRFDIHRQIYESFCKKAGLFLTDEELYLHFLISNNDRFYNERNMIKPSEIYVYFKKILAHYRDDTNYEYIAFTVYRRGLSLSRWYLENKYFYFFVFLSALLYHRILILFK